MALSEWHHWDTSLGPIDDLRDVLAASWMRRKRYEALVLIGTLGEAMADKRSRYHEVSPDEMLHLMGA